MWGKKTDVVISICNTSSKDTSKPRLKAGFGGWFSWTVYIETDPKEFVSEKIDHVVYYLHPTFAESTIAVTTPPFRLSSSGWGEFVIKLDVVLKDNKKRKRLSHHLTLLSGSDNGEQVLSNRTVHKLSIGDFK